MLYRKTDKDETYFIASYNDEPDAVYFSKVEAFNSSFPFLYSFNACGKRVNAYCFTDSEYIKTEQRT